MANTPFFSIIIPLYNAERYIKICVDSILAQTFQDFEVIIIDDASTDNSYKLCKKLYGNNKKIRLIKQEKNAGSGAARNIGIKNAHGEYIWFVDNDDAILPVALEKAYKATKTGKDIDAIHFNGHYFLFQDDEKPIDMSNAKLYFENRQEGLIDKNILKRISEHWLENRIPGSTWLGIYKRKLLTKNSIEFPNCRADDVPVAFATMCFAENYLLVREAIYIWRQRESSLSHSKDIKQLCNSIKSLPMLRDDMDKIMDKVPALQGNRVVREQCLIQIWEILFRDHMRPLYDGVNISPELDQKVYETMLPIFGENTTLVKYLFHGFNTMWRQANTLAQQNQLLRDREKLLQQQKNLLEKISQLVNSNENLIHQNTLLANQNKLLEQMGGLLEQHSRQLKQPQK